MDPKSKTSRSRYSLEGKYANYFRIGFNSLEFIVDFGQYDSESDQAELYTRIITGPSHAKMLHETLQDSIRKYEAIYGAISIEEHSSSS